MFVNLLFLPVAFFIGIVTSYEDFRYGKIRNKWLKLGLIWGVGAMLILFLWNFVGNYITDFFYFRILDKPTDFIFYYITINNSFFYLTFINFIFAGILSFIMWKFNAWAAGDAKLFIVFSLLIPTTNYWKSYLPLFPSIALLINIFISLIIGLFFYSLYIFICNILDKKKDDNSTKDKIIAGFNNFFKYLKGSFKIFPLIYFIIILFFFYGKTVGDSLNFNFLYLQITIFTLIIIFSSNISKLFKNKYIYILFIVLSIIITGFQLFISFDYSLPIIFRALYMLIGFMVAFILFNNFLNIYVNRVELEEININDLKINMIIDPLVRQKFNFGKSADLNSLTKPQVVLIKEKYKYDNKNKIFIQKRFPFAVWIMIGMLVSVITKGTIIGIIINLITG